MNFSPFCPLVEVSRDGALRRLLQSANKVIAAR